MVVAYVNKVHILWTFKRVSKWPCRSSKLSIGFKLGKETYISSPQDGNLDPVSYALSYAIVVNDSKPKYYVDAMNYSDCDT